MTRAFDPKDRISKHFSFHEALWLPSWGRLANEADGLKDSVIDNLEFLLAKVDQVLDHFGWLARVHVCYRPWAYNQLIGGAHASAHLADRPNVAAIDFDPMGVNCEAARQSILKADLLESLSLRCENNGPASDWIHLDSAPVPDGGHRYFKP